MFTYVWKRRTDAERIERIRARIKSAGRMRPWLIASFVPLIIAYIALGVDLGHRIEGWAQWDPEIVWTGFLSGFISGSLYAGLGVMFLHFLAMMLLYARNERFLLQRYDAALAGSRGEINAPPVSGEEGVP